MKTSYAAVLIAVALATGFVSGRGSRDRAKSSPTKQATPEPVYGGTISLRKSFANSTQLTPHLVIVDGVTVVKKSFTDSDVWSVSLDDGRIQISATEIK